ncbi:MAG: HEAT repeat domain-containing protein [Planctomycetota bacterium]|jgi:HEAT repeat protein
MKYPKICSGANFIFAAAVVVLLLALADGLSPIDAVSAGEDAGGEKPASTGTGDAAPQPKPADKPETSGEEKPKTGGAEQPKAETGGGQKAPPRTPARKESIYGKPSEEVKNRVNTILNDIMKEHKGDPADLIGLEDELFALGPTVVEVLAKRMGVMSTPSPFMRYIFARVIARYTGSYLPHVTNKEIQYIQTKWLEKVKTMKFEEVRAERLKELAGRIEKEGKYIEFYSIADQLAFISDPGAVEALKKLLGHEDSLLKQKALISLGYQKSPEALKIIVPYVKSENERVATSAITALGLSGIAEAKEHLAPLLDSESDAKKPAAVLALHRLGEGGHVDILRNIIENEENPDRLRIWALNVLGEVGSYSDHEWLTELLETKPALNFYRVGRTLERLVWKTFGFTDEGNVTIRKRLELVTKFKTWKVNSKRLSREQHLVPLLIDPNWIYRKRAFEELKTIAEPGGVQSEYDPISKVTDCEQNDDEWEFWLEDRERSR